MTIELTRTTGGIYAAVAMTEDIFSELSACLEDEVETAALCQAGIAHSTDGVTLLVREIDWVPERHYLERYPLRLKIGSAGFVPGFTRAAREGTIPVFFHSHPRGGARASDQDDKVEAELRRLALMRTGGHTFGAIVLGGTRSQPTFSARIYLDPELPPVAAEKVRIVGRHLRIIPSHAANYSFDPEVFDRQIRAFGRHGQTILRSLRVGVVGGGGTGSATFEQLVRLGIGHVTLVDDDFITTTNVTRIHQSAVGDAGERKTTVLAKQARRIGLDTEIIRVDGRVTNLEIAKRLRQTDVVFGCTDDHWGRAVLSRLAYYYLIPVIDMGVVIDTDHNDRIREIVGRVTTVMPNTACLLCRNVVDRDRMRFEQLAASDRERLASEGYAHALADPDPSVVAYTTLTSSSAVSELIDRVFNLGDPNVSSELLLRMLARAISKNGRNPAPDCYCGDQWYWGRGDTEDYLGMMWPG